MLSSKTGSEKPAAIEIFGPPYSGKGTVGERLQADNPHLFYHFSSGGRFRDMNPNSDAAKKIKRIMAAGELVPDEVTYAFLDEEVVKEIAAGKYDPNKHVMLRDGPGRTPAQVALEYKRHNVLGVLYFPLDDNMLLDRFRAGRLGSGRIDDKVETAVKRIREYHKVTEPGLLSFNPDRIVTIDATKDKDTVYQNSLEQALRLVRMHAPQYLK